MSDILRTAFILAYGSELKGYRINPDVNPGDNHSSCSRQGNLTQILLSPVNSQAMVSYIENDPWVESMSAFVANKRSPQTSRAYRLVLKEFLSFVAKRPSDVNQSDVIRYRHQLEHLGRAPASIRQHLAAISGYYNFCICRNLGICNPVKGVNRPSVDAYTGANWLTKNQARALLAEPDLKTVKGKRDYAILLTLLLTGLRRSELSNVQRGDIEERGGKLYLTYICKGGTKIARDIPRRCWDAIEEYLIASGRQITEDSLFSANKKVPTYGIPKGDHPVVVNWPAPITSFLSSSSSL